MSPYGYIKNSYEYGFKEHYKDYLRKKDKEYRNDTMKFANFMTLTGRLYGIDADSAIDIGTNTMKALTNH